MAVLMVATLIACSAVAGESPLPKTFKGNDPKGWRQFQWQMPKAKAKELGARDLTYPNAYYKSHDWIVGSTKIVLHHGCPKPGKPTASQPTTHIWYEKRLEFEPWNR
jgi:hypothetical protein